MVEPTQSGDAAVRTPSRRLPSRLLLAVGVIGTGLVLILTIGVSKPEQPAEPTPTVTAQPLAPPPGATAPRSAVAAPEDRPRASDLEELDTWARGLVEPTKLAVNVLAAYGRAEMWMRVEWPGCHLSWSTLAGIGQTEAAAAGPLPVSDPIWQRWAARATRDGKPADPRNVDDAALTMARYLCSSGADLATPHGWWTTLLAYTQSLPATQDLFTATNAYAAP